MNQETFEENIKIIKEMSLIEIAIDMGYHPVKIGKNYKLQEMDSLIIFNDRTWYRYSQNIGGSQIDFVMKFGNCTTMKEVFEYFGLSKEENKHIKIRLENKKENLKKDEKKFILPERSRTCTFLVKYLHNYRCLPMDVIKYFLNLGLMYEEREHHNIVFLGRDIENRVRCATTRGIMDMYEKGVKYRGDISGSDKNYGVNIINKNSKELRVFEAAIDCMSYIALSGDYTSNKLSLGMTSDKPLVQLLKDYSHIKKIIFSLDNDKAGRKAIFGEPEEKNEQGIVIKKSIIGYIDKYKKQGYETSVSFPEYGKDYNECLIEQRRK